MHPVNCPLGDFTIPRYVGTSGMESNGSGHARRSKTYYLSKRHCQSGQFQLHPSEKRFTFCHNGTSIVIRDAMRNSEKEVTHEEKTFTGTNSTWNVLNYTNLGDILSIPLKRT